MSHTQNTILAESRMMWLAEYRKDETDVRQDRRGEFILLQEGRGYYRRINLPWALQGIK